MTIEWSLTTVMQMIGIAGGTILLLTAIVSFVIWFLAYTLQKENLDE